MTTQACFKWFSHCFLPQAQAHNTSGKPIALLMDGHNSHVTKELRTHAEANGVHIYTFPSHTTHKLQPLNVGVFRSLQQAWQGCCVEILQQRNTEVTQCEFVGKYLTIRDKFFTPALIQKVFKNTGIHPLNPNIFTTNDFAPSQISSHRAHIPLSYPEPHLRGEFGDGNHVDEWGSNWECEGDSDEEEVEGADNQIYDSGNDDIMSLDGSDVFRESGAGRSGEGSWDVRHKKVWNVVGDSEVAVDGSSTTSTDNRTQCTQPSVETSNDIPLNLTLVTTRAPHLSPRPHVDPPALPTSIEDLQARIRELEAENESLHTHTTMAYREIDHLQHGVNAKKSKNGKGKGWVALSTVGARWWTVGSGRELALEKDAEDEVKAKTKAQVAAEKCEKADERQRRRVFLTAPFGGALSSKSKEDLKDITWAFSLAVDPKATKSDLQQLITEHTDCFLHLAENPHFTGLYVSCSRLKRLACPPDENIMQPPPSISSVPSFSPPTVSGPVVYPVVPRSPMRSPLSLKHTMIPPRLIFAFDDHINLNEEKAHFFYNASTSSNSPFYPPTQTHSPLHFSYT